MTANTFRKMALTTLVSLLFASTATAALAQDDQAARIKALEDKVNALVQEVVELKKENQANSQQVVQLKSATDGADQQIADLKTSTAAQIDDVRTVATATQVSIAGGKPSIVSADGAFSVNLHGVLQLDAANYDQKRLTAATPGADLNSGTNIRRARIGIDGKAFGNFDYNLLFDFGGSTGTDAGGAGTAGAVLQEGWVQYSGGKIFDYPLRLRVGVFAPNVGLEDAASTNSQLFVERPSPAEIARTSLAGGDRRIGAQAQSNGDHWLAAFAVTGARAGDTATADEQLGFTGRIAGTPLFGQDWRVHIGVNGSYVDKAAQPTALSPVTAFTFSDRPELRVDGTQLITTGAIDIRRASHVGGELAFQKGPFFVEGEYFQYQLERRIPLARGNDPHFNGWYTEAGYFLTGEARKYNAVNGSFDGPAVAKPFNPSLHQWGAWELAARYSDTDLNYGAGAAGVAALVGSVRGGEQKIWTAGLNWFPNGATRFSVEYQDVDVARLNAAGFQIGQKYNAVAVRSQVAF